MERAGRGAAVPRLAAQRREDLGVSSAQRALSCGAGSCVVPPSPSLGLGFPGCETETGARKLCFWEQVLLLRNEDKAQHWGRGGRERRESYQEGKGCTRGWEGEPGPLRVTSWM